MPASQSLSEHGCNNSNHDEKLQAWLEEIEVHKRRRAKRRTKSLCVIALTVVLVAALAHIGASLMTLRHTPTDTVLIRHNMLPPNISATASKAMELYTSSIDAFTKIQNINLDLERTQSQIGSVTTDLRSAPKMRMPTEADYLEMFGIRDQVVSDRATTHGIELTCKTMDIDETTLLVLLAIDELSHLSRAQDWLDPDTPDFEWEAIKLWHDNRDILKRFE